MRRCTDGKRILVQVRAGTDPEAGGQYTLKRWKVSKLSEDGGAEEIELQPDNSSHKPIKFSAASGDVRPVAEFVSVVA